MTITELHIQLDLQHENRIDILEDATFKCGNGYLFVDSADGHCYLFDENGNEDDIKKIKYIGNHAFERENLKSIVIPDSVKCIGNRAFCGCENLKSIKIPNSVKSIGDYAFYYCQSLKSIEIPDSVKSIGNCAFESCENLKSVVIPNFVKNIGIYVFYGCKSLKSIVIPDSVEGIGDGTFEYCKSLKSIVFKGKTLNQVKAMYYYPFGIEDESIIKCI